MLLVALFGGASGSLSSVYRIPSRSSWTTGGLLALALLARMLRRGCSCWPLLCVSSDAGCCGVFSLAFGMGLALPLPLFFLCAPKVTSVGEVAAIDEAADADPTALKLTAGESVLRVRRRVYLGERGGSDEVSEAAGPMLDDGAGGRTCGEVGVLVRVRCFASFWGGPVSVTAAASLLVSRV